VNKKSVEASANAAFPSLFIVILFEKYISKCPPVEIFVSTGKIHRSTLVNIRKV
jgi:hypothetical protein